VQLDQTLSMNLISAADYQPHQVRVWGIPLPFDQFWTRNPSPLLQKCKWRDVQHDSDQTCNFRVVTNLLHNQVDSAEMVGHENSISNTNLKVRRGQRIHQHCTHTDRVDKHGVTPEMPAQENGNASTAEVLRAWVENKDRDLRERGGGVVTNGHGKDRKASCTSNNPSTCHMQGSNSQTPDQCLHHRTNIH